jgi:hypothetical protein
MEKEFKRPTSITVISWVWIGIGILMVFGGFMGFISYAVMQVMSEGQPFPPDLPPEFQAEFKPMMLLFRNFHILAGAQFIIAIIAILSGIYFLKLRSWARTTLEGLTWLSLLYIIAFGIYWVYIWISITGNIPQDEMGRGMEYFKYFGAVMGAVINLMFAAPLVIMIVTLRGKTIKSVVA